MPGAGLWPVKMDPAQIDQVLANLLVNARDAIDGVGKVTVETRNAVLDEACCAGRAGCVPGEYVVLAVRDDGCGMDEDVLDRLFEPFFTTKPVGKGTGLGLATVYGIVKQNGGFIDVAQRAGQGHDLQAVPAPMAGQAPDSPGRRRRRGAARARRDHSAGRGRAGDAGRGGRDAGRPGLLGAERGQARPGPERGPRRTRARSIS